MLPPGFTADLASTRDQAALRALYPASRTGVHLRSGACACDVVIGHSPSRDEERELRRRFFAAGVSREEIIPALERHRRGGRFVAPTDARAALAGFVAEHARNAGPTLYLLRFGQRSLDEQPPADLARLTVRDVLVNKDGWLREDRPTIVEP